jgi:hypothetical protein
MVRSDTVSSRLEWCFLRASYFASRGVMKRAVPRDFPGCSNPVLSAFANGLRSPSAKEKVDTREWKVDFLDQRVLVLYFLLSTFYPLRSLRRCISRRAAQIESFFESCESPKH